MLLMWRHFGGSLQSILHKQHLVRQLALQAPGAALLPLLGP